MKKKNSGYAAATVSSRWPSGRSTVAVRLVGDPTIKSVLEAFDKCLKALKMPYHGRVVARYIPDEVD